MDREYMFCVLLAVGIVQVTTVVCLPDGYRERFDTRGTVPNVQTMTIPREQKLLGAPPPTRKQHTDPNPLLPSTGHGDSTVVEERVVEKYPDDFKFTSAMKAQRDQHTGFAITMKLEDRNSGLHVNQARANKLLQTVTTEETIQVQTKEPIRVQTKEPIQVQTDEPIRVQTKGPIQVQTDGPIRVQTKESIQVQTDEPIRVQTKTLSQEETTAPIKVETQEPINVKTKESIKENKEPVNVATRASMNVDRNEALAVETSEPVSVGGNSLINEKTTQPVSVVRYGDQPLKVNTESPPMGDRVSRRVTKKVMPHHEVVRGFVSGRESSVNLQRMGLAQLTGFHSNKEDARLINKTAKQPFGDREISWIIKIQQIVFDDGEDENQQVWKATNRKERFGGKVAKHLNNANDVFWKISSGNKMRHLLEAGEKDNTDGEKAPSKDNTGSDTTGKEPEKEKSGPASDTSYSGTDDVDIAATGSLSLDSPKLDSVIQKAFNSMPNTGEAQSGQNSIAKAYGITDMSYPFRQDLQSDSDEPPNLKLTADLFGKDRMDPAVDEAMSSLKQNYVADFLNSRNIRNKELDYGNRNDDSEDDDGNFDELIKDNEDDERSFKAAQVARLTKRSAQGMLGDSDVSANDHDDGSPKGSQDARLYKRSVQDMHSGSVNDDDESAKNSRDARLHKRYVQNMHSDSVNDDDGDDESQKSSQHAKLYKRSVQEMPGASVNDDDDDGSQKNSEDAKLYKRSVQDTQGDSVNNDDDGSPKDSEDARLYKRSVQDTPGDSVNNDDDSGSPKDYEDAKLNKRSIRDVGGKSGVSVNDANGGSSKDFQDARLYKRSVRDIPYDPDAFKYDVNDESSKDSIGTSLNKRSVQDANVNSDVSVKDDKVGAPKDVQDAKLYKRFVQDMLEDTVNEDDDGPAKDSQDSRVSKRSAPDVSGKYGVSDKDRSEKDSKEKRINKRSEQDSSGGNGMLSNDGDDSFSKDPLVSKLFKRSVQDVSGDSGVSASDDINGPPSDSPDGARLHKRSVEDMSGESGLSVNGNSDGSPNDSQKFRLYKRSVEDMPDDSGVSVNDDSDVPRKDSQDARIVKRDVQDVSGKYGVSVNDNDDDDGSLKEYDIEIENGVKKMRFPTEEKPMLVKREASNSEVENSGLQHSPQERGHHHRHNNTWIDGAVKDSHSSGDNKAQHGDSGGKIYVSGEGTPTLVGLVLIPVNSDGTIKEDKDAEERNNVQYQHHLNHHRRPCNHSHGGHSSAHHDDHYGGEGKRHPCHHGHRKGHHGRHRLTEHHVVGRTDSQQAQSYYHSEIHPSEEQHRETHSEKHVASSQHSAHKGEYEKQHFESPEGFRIHENEGNFQKGHSVEHGSNQHGGKREELIAETFRTEQIAAARGQRPAHNGNAVHVLVILSIFLVCFTVILFLIVRSRSGGHVREINSRTALYVPQAKY